MKGDETMNDKIYGEFEEHVKTGDKVWYAGDMIDDTKMIVVGPSYHSEEWRRTHKYDKDHCYEEVNSLWNKLYFNNREDAEHKLRNYRAGFYDSFQYC